jgi:hypothetical protein
MSSVLHKYKCYLLHTKVDTIATKSFYLYFNLLPLLQLHNKIHQETPRFPLYKISLCTKWDDINNIKKQFYKLCATKQIHAQFHTAFISIHKNSTSAGSTSCIIIFCKMYEVVKVQMGKIRQKNNFKSGKWEKQK